MTSQNAENPEVLVPDSTTADAARRLYEIISGQWAACAVRTAAELGVMDAVDDHGSLLADVAAAVQGQESGVRRLLNACQSLGLVNLEPTDRVRLTAVGALLRSDHPGSLRALARLQGTPGVWRLWEALPDAVRAGTSSAPRTLGAPLFDFLREHPDEGAVFGQAMRDLTGLVEDQARRTVDLDADGRRLLVVDVGGGTGSFLAALLEAAPTARGTVLDTAEVVAAADPQAFTADVRGRLTYQAGDFFTNLPPADWYVLKSVLSDWADADAVRILRACRNAARPFARLLLVEQLLGASPAGQTDLAALMDMTLLALTTGGARELAEYDHLAQAGGWQRRRVRPAPAGYAFVELSPTDEDSPH